MVPKWLFDSSEMGSPSAPSGLRERNVLTSMNFSLLL
jgi:hypothetical protein